MALVKLAWDDFSDVGNGVSIENRPLKGDAGLHWGAMPGYTCPVGDGAGRVHDGFYFPMNADGTPFTFYKGRVLESRPHKTAISTILLMQRYGDESVFLQWTNHQNDGVSINQTIDGTAIKAINWRSVGAYNTMQGLEVTGHEDRAVSTWKNGAVDESRAGLSCTGPYLVRFYAQPAADTNGIEIWVDDEDRSEAGIWQPASDNFCTGWFQSHPANGSSIANRVWTGPGTEDYDPITALRWADVAAKNGLTNFTYNTALAGIRTDGARAWPEHVSGDAYRIQEGTVGVPVDTDGSIINLGFCIPETLGTDKETYLLFDTRPQSYQDAHFTQKIDGVQQFQEDLVTTIQVAEWVSVKMTRNPFTITLFDNFNLVKAYTTTELTDIGTQGYTPFIIGHSGDESYYGMNILTPDRPGVGSGAVRTRGLSRLGLAIGLGSSKKYRMR